MLDTTHEYEPHVFHNFLFPILMEEESDPRWVDLLQGLVETFDQFYDLPQGLSLIHILNFLLKNGRIKEYNSQSVLTAGRSARQNCCI